MSPVSGESHIYIYNKSQLLTDWPDGQLDCDVEVKDLLDQVLIIQMFMKSRRGSEICLGSLCWVAYIPAVNCFEGKINNGLIAFLLSKRLSSAARSLVCLLLNNREHVPAFWWLRSWGGSSAVPACVQRRLLLRTRSRNEFGHRGL